jgi:hypothetical protein
MGWTVTGSSAARDWYRLSCGAWEPGAPISERRLWNDPAFLATAPCWPSDVPRTVESQSIREPRSMLIRDASRRIARLYLAGRGQRFAVRNMWRQLPDRCREW